MVRTLAILALLGLIVLLLAAESEARTKFGYGESPAAKDSTWTDPDFQSIMFCPTPATQAGGHVYLRNFMLFVFNFGYSPGDRVNLTFGSVIPINDHPVTFGHVGAKIMLLDRESFPVGLALTGSSRVLGGDVFRLLGGVIGVGDRQRSLNLFLSRRYLEEGKADLLMAVGGDLEIARGLKIFLEMASTDTRLEEQEDYVGYFNVGLKFFWESGSFLVGAWGAVRKEGPTKPVPFPLAMFSAHW